MASLFKIPKKKNLSDSDSESLTMQSPLSRLQNTAQDFKGYRERSGRGKTDRMHAGSTTDRESTPVVKPFFRDVVKNLLGLNSSNGKANHSAAGGVNRQSQPGKNAANGRWRPKRASDRLLQLSLPHKKKSPGTDAARRRISVTCVDSLAMQRGGEEEEQEECDDRKSDDDFLSPSKPSSSSSLRPAVAPGNSLSQLQEERRRRWEEFRARKRSGSAALHLHLKKNTHTPSEPIVLSSEEEEQSADRAMTSQSGRAEESQVCPPLAPPSFLQLEFDSLHVGLTHADANGRMMITENGITLPLRGAQEEGEVTVVASQVRGYGVWDGGVARGGTLLARWDGPTPSLLFLWVTDAQARLLHTELAAMHDRPAAAPPCSFLLLVLKEQLQELQAALLTSILDMEEFSKARPSPSSSSSGPSSPLDWTNGLLLLHSCPPPLDQHLLRLVGHTQGRSKKSSSLQQLPSRLIQYPAPPCKGRITVTREDLACLGDGEFLNDVIIDFYLKFLFLEGVGGPVADRSHVFSSFFYKQLSRRRAAGEDGVASVPDRHTRHSRVKTWTRHVDIFTKDFLFVPVNQEAHWFLVVVCFPSLQQPCYEQRRRTTDVSVKSPPPPPCTEQGCQKDSVLKRPCILVMDSLKLSQRDTVCRLLREYLEVEWEVRKGSRRLFQAECFRSAKCSVPQQQNSSDCGLYLLQYTHSFLQNPVVHFDLPPRLDNWFPQQQVRQKREEIRALILRMHRLQHD